MTRAGEDQPVAVPTDDDLVRMVLAGDTAAFAQLIRRHQTGVYRTVAATLGTSSTVADAVQQAFINAYDRLDQYDAALEGGHRTRDGAGFGIWVRAIARNLVRDDLRRREREQRHLARYRREFFPDPEDPGAVEWRFARLQDTIALCRKRLAPAADEVVRLRYDHDLDLAAIATAIGRSIGATRQLLFRAREALRQCIEAHEGFHLAQEGSDG